MLDQEPLALFTSLFVPVSLPKRERNLLPPSNSNLWFLGPGSHSKWDSEAEVPTQPATQPPPWCLFFPNIVSWNLSKRVALFFTHDFIPCARINRFQCGAQVTRSGKVSHLGCQDFGVQGYSSRKLDIRGQRGMNAPSVEDGFLVLACNRSSLVMLRFYLERGLEFVSGVAVLVARIK